MFGWLSNVPSSVRLRISKAVTPTTLNKLRKRLCVGLYIGGYTFLLPEIEDERLGDLGGVLCATGPLTVQPRSQRRQTFADAEERVAVDVIAEPELELLGALTRLGEQALLGTLQGQALVVEKRLDP